MSAAITQRDHRIDFFRGLALTMIFIDHIPGIGLAHLTLKNFGFSDATEVFVFLAGFSAVLAYGKTFDRDGLGPGSMRVGSRIWEIYYWHLGVLAVSFTLLMSAMTLFGDPAYLHNIGLWEFVFTPLRSLGEALALTHQPNMLNILPLYIALLAWLPVMFWLLRRSHLLALGVSFAIWLIANVARLNLPSTLEITGWVFNPFAWQLLFTVGAVAAARIGVRQWQPPGWLLALAAAYLAFAFLIAAPWTQVPGLEKVRPISADLLGHLDRTYLSLWRVVHILAFACVVAAAVRPQAHWLFSPVAHAIGRCGRHSLEIFCLGTILSFAGWIVLNEVGTGFGMQLAVSAAGIGVMATAAWYLEQRKRALKRRQSLGEKTPAPPFGFLRQ